MYTLTVTYSDDTNGGIILNRFGSLVTFAAEVAEVKAIVRERGGRLETADLEYAGVEMPLSLKEFS